MNKYFKIASDEDKRILPLPLEEIMLKYFKGVITLNECRVLYSGLIEKYKRLGKRMEGYLCWVCEQPLTLTYEYGPLCAQGRDSWGCGNLPKNSILKLWKTARDIRTVTVEKAAEVIESAMRIPGTIIDTARKTPKEIKRRVEDFLG